MSQTPDLFSAAVKMFGSLGLVLLIVAVLFYFFRRFVHNSQLGSKNNLIRVLATHYFGAKKSVAILKVPGAFLVVGLTSDRINLLARLKENAFSDTASLDNSSGEEKNFLATLLKLSPKGINRDGRRE